MPSDATSQPAPIDTTLLAAQVRPGLVRFFRRRCSSLAQAEDLAQEVILRTLNRAGLTTLDRARGYIFRAAANLWRDQQRRQLAQQAAEVDWEDDTALNVSEGVALDRALLGEEELYRVNAALLELGERTRDIFVLHRLEQMKYSAIAQTLGISVSAVEKHMSKALAHLSLRIDDHDVI